MRLEAMAGLGSVFSLTEKQNIWGGHCCGHQSVYYSLRIISYA